MRGDFEQVEPAARAIVGAPAVSPGHHAQLRPAESGEIHRPVDDVPRQGGHFLLQRGEASRAGRVRLLVDLRLSLERRAIHRRRRGLLRRDGGDIRDRKRESEWM